ncbi:hypothetical protein EN836_28990 [Mesorhizobium sp. M1C.F.Ca.ET.193.01.1.1]|uniref:hypothetical protein n=1 Tax=unclassified Mesorhizobium TaxID=325217 RepID=UPI000FD24DB8|nr:MULTISPECIES: hypothetical protein [unclassified Mesorhizobium]TGS92915.1 hypothetical protein EN820_49650 [bacterium M00.F.Ca.ET.177.01.1.1]TGQ50431.1 hypothetical protein EN853_28980 [Mesorhizobium sp. M1C.F.Ca.ET.210.01.1.1]TGQ65355.1 hypothetical protein EN855_028995 [Mesorhizobium sp. M1C.F.Ca.ET.212.01.1.1]TGQ99280.1 hypothetical protein EN847_28980 [Mesorhizobium sp. M1C.F.Ca.ET.204.01.1.1]TGR19611.1 hypothetical protein EN839_28980 [Mesorhizobium sp. M1C.F.Ca.ET.196.01.1.1]
MDVRISKRRTTGQMPVFELDALREAFRRSVRENNVTEVQWAEHAERFVKSMIRKESRGIQA